MAEQPKTNDLMERIVSLCKRRGFIFQSSEIYGGINGFWDYGPLGAELKRNLKDFWWKSMTQRRDDVVGLEATIIMHPKIWEASGHTTTFSDPMVDCLLTKKRFRADQVEAQSGVVYSYTGADSAAGLKVDRPFSVLLKKGENPERARKVARQYYAQGATEGADALQLRQETTENVENTTRYNPENGSLLTEARPFNLMFKTHYGPLESDDNVAYLRPETAQAIFVQFKNVLEVSRQRVPFGICQIGKAFRNEINPRNYTFRSREFEQMELEFFIRPDEVVEAIYGSVAKPPGPGHPGEPQPNWGWQMWHQYWVEERLAFYESIGLPRTSLVEYWQKADELAHYARATVDILYKFPFSKRDEKGELMGEELEGVAARSDFDLSQHQRSANKPMGVFDDDLRVAWAKLDPARQTALGEQYYASRKNYLTKVGEKPEQAETTARAEAAALAKGSYVPHVIEPSAGVDRLALALICNAFAEDQAPDDKGKMETRVVMRFHPRIAPVKVAIFPLLKNKPELVQKALAVRDLLRPHMTVFYDEAGAIGRRYRRQDEAGTPFGVTIDFDTLGEKGPELQDTVTLRDRDTMQQSRVKISELLSLLLAKTQP
ncbi:MAG TPA: glycine--tRNA ligase [Verrucomicrobiae bacterium]|jgi:glycyl-tRNA synthetase|nr:glycine--tRNA ligase [Verrucomicrobiae bacterium]